ncbi:hypothetical protein ABIB25_004286 [Nakamurella sp. UYEF19]|uniref:hypothetical protein n=1 Tax=Nakamurella sp. UYEF19 TaxID=1756392 RepID=UPI003392E317
MLSEHCHTRSGWGFGADLTTLDDGCGSSASAAAERAADLLFRGARIRETAR